MSSDPASRTRRGRCLLCSLGCRVEVERFGPRQWRPTCNGEGQGPCARGQQLVDLMQNPRRQYRPAMRGQACGLSEALGALVERVAQGRTSVWLDGNAALDDLDLVLKFVRADADRRSLLVHVPWSELGAVEGLDAGGAVQTPPDRWKDADAYLVIGQPTATHPSAMRHFTRNGSQRARPAIVAIDSVSSYLTSATPNGLVCRPGLEWCVLAAVLEKAGFSVSGRLECSEADLDAYLMAAGLSAAQVASAAEALKKAQRPAVIVAPPIGDRAAWRLVSELSAAWADQQDGTITVLTTCANALGMARAMRRHGLDDWRSVAQRGDANEADNLLILGWDPTSAYPAALWEHMLANVDFVAAATAYPVAEPDRFDLLLPAALASEAGGAYVLAAGESERVSPLLEPPAGSLTVYEFIARCTDIDPAGVPDASAGVNADATDAPEPDTPSIPMPPTDAAIKGWRASLCAEPTHYADGQMTQHTRWAERFDPLPTLHMASTDARTLHVAEGQVVRVSNERGETYARVSITPGLPTTSVCYADTPSTGGQPGGWVALSAASPAVRRLAAWRCGHRDDPTAAATVDIEIATLGRRTPQEEVVHAGR